MSTTAAERLKALGHPGAARHRAGARRAERCCCGDVCSRLPLAQSTVSQHLKVLKEAGLVSFRRDGVRSSYVLNPSAFAALRSDLKTSIVSLLRGGLRRPRRRRDRMMADAAAPKVSADRGATFSALWNLWPYMWPADRPDLKLRVLIAFAALLAAKIVSVLVPYSFKWATDALAGRGRAAVLRAAPHRRRRSRWCSPTMSAASSRPASRRSATRSSHASGLHAVRQLAYRTFVHLHDLSLRFHLERRTGGLSRIIERGTTGIENIVRHVILNTAPTVIEFALTAGDRLVPVRLLVRRRDRRHGLALRLVHDPGERLAHHHPPRDERFRHRRAFQGDQLAAELRDGQIFRQRAARGGSLRPLHGALRARGGAHLDVARRAESRPGGDLRRRHGDLHGDVGARHHGRDSRRSAISC